MVGEGVCGILRVGWRGQSCLLSPQSWHAFAFYGSQQDARTSLFKRSYLDMHIDPLIHIAFHIGSMPKFFSAS